MSGQCDLVALCSEFFIQVVENKRLPNHVREFLQDFELPVRPSFPDIHVLRGMMILLYRGLTTRSVEGDLSGFKNRPYFVHIKRTGLLDR